MRQSVQAGLRAMQCTFLRNSCHPSLPNDPRVSENARAKVELVLIELYAKLQAIRPQIPSDAEVASALESLDGVPAELLRDARDGLALFDAAPPGSPAFNGLVAIVANLMVETYDQTITEFTQLLSS